MSLLVNLVVVTIMVLTSGCSVYNKFPYPHKWTLEEPHRSPYGAPVIVSCYFKDTTGKHVYEKFYGEFIAYEDDLIYILTVDNRWLAIHRKYINQVEICIHKPKQKVPPWAISIVLAPLSLIHFLLGVFVEGPAHLALGSVGLLLDEIFIGAPGVRVIVITRKKFHRMEEVLIYARFPAGLPRGWKARFTSPF